MRQQMTRIFARCRLRHGAISATAMLLGLSACGGETPVPTGPTAPPAPVPVTIRVAPNPLRATQVSVSGGAVTYAFTADVTFSTVTGNGARIDQLTMTTASTQTTPTGAVLSLGVSASSAVSIQVPPGGTVAYPHAQNIGTFSGEKVTWRIGAQGVDSEGRPFTASSAEIPIEFVTTAAGS